MASTASSAPFSRSNTSFSTVPFFMHLWAAAEENGRQPTTAPISLASPVPTPRALPLSPAHATGLQFVPCRAWARGCRT